MFCREALIPQPTKLVDLMDRIRQMEMDKMFLRRKLSRKLEGKILPNVMKELNKRSRGLKYVWRYSHKDGGTETEILGEVEGVTKDLVHWRHTVDLKEKTCTCRRWQVTGLPCTHALCIITSFRGYNIEDYVHEYYSVAKFKKAYEKSVKPMTDRKQWPKVDPGFKLWPPILKGQLVDQGKEGTNQLQKVALQRDPQDAKGVNSLGT